MRYCAQAIPYAQRHARIVTQVYTLLQDACRIGRLLGASLLIESRTLRTESAKVEALASHNALGMALPLKQPQA